jgi:hypothetical protein
MYSDCAFVSVVRLTPTLARCRRATCRHAGDGQRPSRLVAAVRVQHPRCRGVVTLERVADGRFAYDMKRALPDGRRKLVMTGVELLEKLVPLIPPTYANLTRFHGVFAPTSRLRTQVVPRPTTTPRAGGHPRSSLEPSRRRRSPRLAIALNDLCSTVRARSQMLRAMFVAWLILLAPALSTMTSTTAAPTTAPTTAPTAPATAPERPCASDVSDDDDVQATRGRTPTRVLSARSHNRQQR